jgi:nucleoside-triphosphatase
MKSAWLLTGRPGSGKTSLVRDVATRLGDRAGGFYTEEIRNRGTRQGFRLITLDGQNAILAHVELRGDPHVGRYGVDLAALDGVGIPALERALQSPKLVVIDEIGKMEVLSSRFCEVVSYALASGKKVLGTIMLNSHPFADAAKRMPDVKLVTVTRGSYDAVLQQLLEWAG